MINDDSKLIESAPEFRVLGAACTQLVNRWTGDSGVTVKIHTQPGWESDPLAWYTPVNHDIVLNIKKLVGEARTRDLADMISGYEVKHAVNELLHMLGSAYAPRGTTREAQVHLVGALVHETGHVLTNDLGLDTYFETLSPAKVKILTTLEEIRCEAASKKRITGARLALRKATSIIFPSKEELEKVRVDGGVNALTWSMTAGLVLGRWVTNTLNYYEIGDVLDLTEDLLGAERTARIMDICEEYGTLLKPTETNLERALELVDEWLELFPEDKEADERSNKGGNADGEIISVDGLPDMFDKAVQAAAEMADKWAANEEDEFAPDEMATGKSVEREFERRSAEHSARTSHDSRTGGWRSRPPKAWERSAATLLSRSLEKLHAPARTAVKRSSEAPPGRLKPRALVQRAADRSQGRQSTALPWSSTKKKHVDANVVTVGVMTDTSGSQSWATEVSASFSWIINRATSHIGGKSGAVTFGDHGEISAMPGELEKVMTQEALGGTEKFNSAAALIDKMLGLSDKNVQGVKVLVVFTDGQLVEREEMKVSRDWIAAWRAAGTHIIWMTPSSKDATYAGVLTWPEGTHYVHVDRYETGSDAVAQHMVRLGKEIEKVIKSHRM